MGHRTLPARPFLTLLLAGILAVLTVALAPHSSVQAAGANIKYPSIACSDGQTAAATFNWTPLTDSHQQSLDISLQDNGFATGTYISKVLGSSDATYTWGGLKDGLAHVWRVNSQTSDGSWVASATGSFVPCGSPIVLSAAASCIDSFRAAIDFRWAPSSNPGKDQWLDIGFDPTFVAGSYATVGPFTLPTGSYRWNGVQANVDTYYRVDLRASDGTLTSGPYSTFNAACAAPVSTDIYSSNDTLVISRLGINAPVNVRDVDATGVLMNPAGPTDVVRYRFPLYPPYGGYPGGGGTTIIAGHLDYHDYGDAVFSPLRDVQVGDEIDYYSATNGVVKYLVDWYNDLPDDYAFATLAQATTQDTIVLVTCNGTFDFQARNYDHRRVVHAVKIG